MTRIRTLAAAGTPEAKVSLVGSDGSEHDQEGAPMQGDSPLAPLYWPC